MGKILAIAASQGKSQIEKRSFMGVHPKLGYKSLTPLGWPHFVTGDFFDELFQRAMAKTGSPLTPAVKQYRKSRQHHDDDYGDD